MSRPTAVSTFAVTAAILVLIVAFSLRQGARADTPDNTTQIVYLPVAGLTHGDTGRVHVVNLTTDHSAAPLRFQIAFLDTRGVMLGPEHTCDVGAGDTCSASLPFDQCFSPIPGAPKAPRCEFRAVVFFDGTLPCQPQGGPDNGVGNWMTDLDLL